jgi:hypothetical protein
MLYIDVGNTLRGGLRTGIQRVGRSLSYELAVNAPTDTRLIAFDVAAGRYFVLADPELIQSAGSLTDIGREARVYFDFAAFTQGDIFFEPDSSWTEPLNRGALFRRLEAQGVIVVVLNHNAIPIILLEFCHPIRSSHSRRPSPTTCNMPTMPLPLRPASPVTSARYPSASSPAQ